MEAKDIWDQACKQIIEDISKVFLDEENLSKFSDQMDRVKFRALGKKIKDFPVPEFQHHHVPLNWSDDDMITFAEWYNMWRTHPKVGTNGYSALKSFKEAKKQPLFNFIPICHINRPSLEKGRDYFVVTDGGNIIQAHYTMITETEGDFFGKDTNELVKVVKIDLETTKRPGGHIA